LCLPPREKLSAQRAELGGLAPFLGSETPRQLAWPCWGEVLPMDGAALRLTSHGRLVIVSDADAQPLDAGLAKRLRRAFERGSGHGLLLLAADEAGTTLPPVFAWWREFGGRYVTPLCTHLESDTAPHEVRVAAPSDEELEGILFSAPPLTGAEYLTAAILESLWHELDQAFGIELSESKCGVQEWWGACAYTSILPRSARTRRPHSPFSPPIPAALGAGQSAASAAGTGVARVRGGGE